MNYFLIFGGNPNRTFTQISGFSLYITSIFYIISNFYKYFMVFIAGLQVVFGPKIGLLIGPNFLKNRV
jgi:hypothetical protein